MGRNIALIGLPRGGTTLACHLLNRVPQVAALSEPMDVELLSADDRSTAVGQVQAFMAETRRELLAHGTAPSKHRDGRIPDNSYAPAQGAGRAETVVLGRVSFTPRPEPGFALFVKHNAAFAALLPELADAVEAIGLVRNPLAILASWNSLAMNASDGRAPAAERLDLTLARRLSALSGRVERQLVLIDWFFARIAGQLPAERVLRYEDIVATRGGALYACAGLDTRGTQPSELREMNANPHYGGFDAEPMARRLCEAPGAWQQLYRPEDIRGLAQRMAAAAAG